MASGQDVVTTVEMWITKDHISTVVTTSLVIMYFRKYKADIEGYVSKLMSRESTASHSSVPRLPWRVWFC